MNTESKKLQGAVSYHNNCGNPDCTLPDTADTSSTASQNSQSGKLDATSVVNTAINGVTDVLTSLFKKTPDTVTNNTTTVQDNTSMYVAAGVGGLLLVVLVFVLLKK